MKWSRWCITASLNYKNTMINRITMETVAYLRSKCHLKQNLIPSWPWSFQHTSCISDFRCKTKYTNKKFCRTPGPAYLAVLPVLVIFCPLGPTNFKKSASLGIRTSPTTTIDDKQWRSKLIHQQQYRYKKRFKILQRFASTQKIPHIITKMNDNINIENSRDNECS
jgi:hypothetical protein